MMISVDDALSLLTRQESALGGESVSVEGCGGRIAVDPIRARMTQPPFAMSAMDGYAVRFADAHQDAALTVIGEAPAGRPFEGVVSAGQAVRIFTGAIVPKGADHIAIQEDVTRNESMIVINDAAHQPSHVRAAGLDFQEGDILVEAGMRLHMLHGAILAAANINHVRVYRAPIVAFFSNGDELVPPGSTLKIGQIVNSNPVALAALIRAWGGEPVNLGCIRDDQKALEAVFARGIAQGADLIVPIGGASVGDYDYVKSAFAGAGGTLTFSKIAVKPGKPTWYGRIHETRVLGLPGNPASAIVTASLFLQPLIRALAGDARAAHTDQARLTRDLPANGRRETYLRAHTTRSSHIEVTPVHNQDSSLLHPFAIANALIRRVIDAPALRKGDLADIVYIRPGSV